MRRAVSTAAPIAGEPMSELNITPLIDVMLVLLVMFIITIPAMTHEVPVDLPQGDGPAREQVVHRLELTREGGAVLDGRAVTDAALPARLRAIREDAAAVLVMHPDPEARYERFDQLLAVVKRAGVTRLGFEGNAALVD